MRIAVFLLLLANLLVLVWTRGYLGAPANPDARRAEQQLLPDHVKVVGRAKPPQATNRKDEDEKAADGKGAFACQFWSDLVSSDADHVERLLA